MDENKIKSILFIEDSDGIKLIDNKGKDITEKLKFSNKIIVNEICEKIITGNDSLILQANEYE